MEKEGLTMSKFHIIGITYEGKLNTLLDGDDLDAALSRATEFVGGYRQLFLVSSANNARELVYTPPTEGGWEQGAYAPLVLER